MAQVDDGSAAAEAAVEQWKIRKLIHNLQAARGNGTSMISLIIPPKDQVSRVQKMLQTEYGTASNIKSRVNRQSVQGAITSVQQRLKLYNRVPDNGLVVYCGTVMTDDGKEKKISIDFEPFKPINTSLYLCDNKFHTEALHELLSDDKRFGFIIMDGNGALFGVLAGSSREIVHKFTVELPKKHGRGGQSALRFARLRLEKRQNYIRKVAETATQVFIAQDRPNVAALILAGSAEFKNKLAGSELFDPRLGAIVAKIVDVSYGGENGFNQAIELAADALANVKFVAEMKLLSNYFLQIAQDTGKYCYGIQDTLQALDSGAAEELIVWENLETMRLVLRNSSTGEETVVHWSPHQEQDQRNYKDSDGNDLEVVEKETLVEWLANNFKRFGARLQFVTDRSQEGMQFCKGFGGLGAVLRYSLDFGAMEGAGVDDDDDFM